MKTFAKYLPYLVLIQVLIATLGSLFFSEIMHLPPCLLCWYQRICMYPLVAITAVGILRKDKGLPMYILPLSITGMLIGIYHNLLYYHILPESIAPCTAGVSCTTKQIELLGFITIPLLSFAAFTFITLCMIIYAKATRQTKKETKRKNE